MILCLCHVGPGSIAHEIDGSGFELSAPSVKCTTIKTSWFLFHNSFTKTRPRCRSTDKPPWPPPKFFHPPPPPPPPSPISHSIFPLHSPSLPYLHLPTTGQSPSSTSPLHPTKHLSPLPPPLKNPIRKPSSSTVELTTVTS